MATNRVSPKKGKVVDIPANAPTIGTASDGGTGTTATVAFTAPSTSTGGPITVYQAISSPGSFTGTGTTSPVTVGGLTSGTSYTFTVAAGSPTGYGPYSSASNSATILTPTSYESIATVTVGSGGQSSVTFSSIPSTYKHLQVRYTGLSASIGSLFMRINGDTNQANYVTHYLSGSGSSAVAGALGSSTGRTAIAIGGVGAGQFSTTYPYVGIVDLLDYTNTNKYHTIRTLNGTDTNNTGYNGVASLISGLHLSTTAISSLDFFLDGSVNLAQYSSFALYGVKG